MFIAIAELIRSGIMFTDLSRPDLESYCGSSEPEPNDFDTFWYRSLDESRSLPVDVLLEPTYPELEAVEVLDVTFSGWAGERVRGWLILPREREHPLPVVVEYVGYGGGRGYPTDHLMFACAGIAHFVMDTRGQGSVWSPGSTTDPHGSAPSYPGFMTRGIADPDHYYYRRLTIDAVRAVEAVQTIPCIDPNRISVMGVSQGGGLALAVAGLVPTLQQVFARVPFLCDFRRATVITDDEPYKEIGRYLAVHREAVERTFATLSYFDNIFHARRATAPLYASCALMDSTCPPSTIYAAFNNWSGPKQMTVYPFNSHEGGGQLENLAAIPIILSSAP